MAKKSKGPEPIIVASKAKAALKSMGCNTAGDALDALNGFAGWIIVKVRQINGAGMAFESDYLRDALVQQTAYRQTDVSLGLDILVDILNVDDKAGRMGALVAERLGKDDFADRSRGSV